MNLKTFKRWLLIMLIAVIVLAVVIYINQPDDRVSISFLDVGQGDAVLIQQGNLQVLIDGGPSPQAITNELGKRMPFWDRKIELVILTHHHEDHLAGLVEVIKRYKVEQVLEPVISELSGEEYDSSLHAEWQRLIADSGIKVVYAHAYQQLELGQVVIDILNPPQALFTGTESDTDNNGVVLTVRAGKISFLLTADLMWQGEHELVMQRLVTACTVLKLGHHGSKTSSSAEFLNVVNPQIAVISVGENNYGHPNAEVLARLEAYMKAGNIYRTDELGTIEFETDGENLWMK
jgi:competence protein ComEC